MITSPGIQPPDTAARPWKNGMVTFISFCTFGAIPLISYVISYAVLSANPERGIDEQIFDPSFLIACLLTAATLFLLGAAKVELGVGVCVRALE